MKSYQNTRPEPTSVRRTSAIAVGLLLVAALGVAQAQNPSKQQQVEQGLLPRVVPKSELGKARTLADRMREQSVPGLSIAVVDGGEITWAQGYGVIETGLAPADTAPVTEDTLFLAGSISKPVSATGAMKLVQDGVLQLDADVNDVLKSWKITYPEVAGSQKVTLRRLLSHTAGLTVHGFAGYAQNKPVPTTIQVLDGESPANSAPVRIDLEPGSQWRYSGGGYTVAQLLIADVSQRPFEEVLRDSVLKPFAMTASTFENPLPEALRPRAAMGHFPTGTRIPTGFHTYPEMAAAGLWTTASDLARWVIGIQRAMSGSDESVLTQSTAKLMLTEQMNNWGLGPGVEGEGDNARFSHGGRDAGFDALMVGFQNSGRGVAILINANNNRGFLGEVLNAVGRVYEWPGFEARQQGYITLDSAVLDSLAGEYVVDDKAFNIRHADDRLAAFSKEIGRAELFAESSTKFFFAGSDDTLEFKFEPAESTESEVTEKATGFVWSNGEGQTRKGTRAP